ncbi:MAG: hypothetical protein IJT59_07150 [Desulfovibrionaceae bacterium]|nr:hypothetical protein [Desulfovibrionaceae bacterium]
MKKAVLIFYNEKNGDMGELLEDIESAKIYLKNNMEVDECICVEDKYSLESLCECIKAMHDCKVALFMTPMCVDGNLVQLREIAHKYYLTIIDYFKCDKVLGDMVISPFNQENGIFYTNKSWLTKFYGKVN